jgi:DNA-binding response OmpR family regulator
LVFNVHGAGYRFDGLLGGSEVLEFGRLRIDPDAHRAWSGPDRIKMSPTEARLLSFLAQHAGTTFSNQQLLEQLWGTRSLSEQTVKSCVLRLRRKLGEHAGLIVTVHGRYRFGPPRRGPEDVVVGDLRIDPAGHSASISGRELDLTKIEFQLLLFFAQHPQRVFSERQLLEQVWSDTLLTPKRVAVRISSLRDKLGHAHRYMIATVSGRGYMFAPHREHQP